MVKTDLKNFYVGENKKVFLSNDDNFEKGIISFKSEKYSFEIDLIQDINKSKNVFSFKTGLIDKSDEYSVFYKYYNETADDTVEKDRIGVIKVLKEESDIRKIQLDYLYESMEAINDRIMGRVRSDYSSYQIDGKSVTAIAIADLERARGILQKQITVLKRKIYGSKTNKMLLGFSDKTNR